MPLEVVMDVESKLLVTKAVAEGFAANPAHVRECMVEAEAAMNVVALQRKRIVCGAPRLVDVRDSALSKDHVELTFHAPTRAA